jgi:hypothetical protein
MARRLAAIVAAAAIALAAAPVATARFVTVTPPPSADLTTYGWCDALGCREPLRLTSPDPAAVYDAIRSSEPSGGRRVTAVDAYGLGSWATVEAVRRLLADAPAPPATTVAAILLRTPTRPNGGLLSRIDARNSTPPSNFNAFGGGQPPGAAVDVSFVDVAREYDGFVDAPSWFNPLSVANAIAGALFLSNYNDTATWRDPRCPNGTCVATATWPVTLPTATGPVYAVARVPDPANPGQTIDISSPSPVGVAVIPTSGDQTVYYTQYTRVLPLLMPLQLPFDGVNHVVAAVAHGQVQPQLTNPLVQVLDPPLRALVNLGYSDVDPANGYTRTLTQPGRGTPPAALRDDVVVEPVSAKEPESRSEPEPESEPEPAASATRKSAPHEKTADVESDPEPPRKASEPAPSESSPSESKSSESTSSESTSSESSPSESNDAGAASE